MQLRNMAGLAIGLFVGLISTCWGSTATAASAGWGDSSCKPFSPSATATQISDSISVSDITFTSCDGHSIEAYWSTPAVKPAKKSPAILFVHWLDYSTNDSNRNEFLSEAKSLAKQGVSSLLVSTFWSIPGGRYSDRRWQDDYSNSLNQTRDLLRELNWIKQQPNIDMSRLAYVGHDYGASFGAMLSGIDHDVKYFVLMAPIAKLTDWYLYGSSTGVPVDDDKLKFIASFDSINPESLIKHSSARFLLQFADSDKYISRQQAESLIHAAPKGSEVHFYSTDHALKIPSVVEDRMTWLKNKLKLN